MTVLSRVNCCIVTMQSLGVFLLFFFSILLWIFYININCGLKIIHFFNVFIHTPLKKNKKKTTKKMAKWAFLSFEANMVRCQNV